MSDYGTSFYFTGNYGSSNRWGNLKLFTYEPLEGAEGSAIRSFDIPIAESR